VSGEVQQAVLRRAWGGTRSWGGILPNGPSLTVATRLRQPAGAPPNARLSSSGTLATYFARVRQTPPTNPSVAVPPSCPRHTYRRNARRGCTGRNTDIPIECGFAVRRVCLRQHRPISKQSERDQITRRLQLCSLSIAVNEGLCAPGLAPGNPRRKRKPDRSAKRSRGEPPHRKNRTPLQPSGRFSRL